MFLTAREAYHTVVQCFRNLKRHINSDTVVKACRFHVRGGVAKIHTVSEIGASFDGPTKLEDGMMVTVVIELARHRSQVVCARKDRTRRRFRTAYRDQLIEIPDCKTYAVHMGKYRCAGISELKQQTILPLFSMDDFGPGLPPFAMRLHVVMDEFLHHALVSRRGMYFAKLFQKFHVH